MIRRTFDPRSGREERAAGIGFGFADVDGEPYWDEGAAYGFSSAQVDVVEDATAGIETMVREACAHAVSRGRREILGIPEASWPLVVRSWDAAEPSLYGRLDLRWDGTGDPKLLEYNADTPTALYEASVVQWEWLVDVMSAADQFNSIHEALVEAWPGLDIPGRVDFSSMRGVGEDRTTVDYLRDTAVQAGLAAAHVDVEDIGWDGRGFTDLAERRISTMFKLYPWEWLLRDSFGSHVAAASTRWIEPAWRLMPSSKGMLALLWELFPGHPNLLEAWREPGRIDGPSIGKPLFGREGANVTAPGISTLGPYADGERVHQAWAELPCFSGRYPVIGSWIVAGRPVGMGIREDGTPITGNASRFVPHFFEPEPGRESRDA